VSRWTSPVALRGPPAVSTRRVLRDAPLLADPVPVPLQYEVPQSGRLELPDISVSRFVSSLWSGASPVVCPCIAVMGVGPTSCNRVDQTTGGAAHDERRGNRGSSMPRGARPGRQLGASVQAAGWITSHLPPAAIDASHFWPVVTTACSWRSNAAARAAWACPRLSLFSVRVVRWVNFAA
jgi:hypothetical protein